VTARNSSFTYKNRVVDVRQVGRELGVRYVLEGSVRRSGSRLRITAQLIEAETHAHVWAERFDGTVSDVFDLQDDITERVVGVIEPSLRRREIERSRRKRPDSLDAYDYYLRALPHMSRMTPREVRLGAEHLERALELDPDYAAAHALLALSHEIQFGQDGFDEKDRAAGLERARTTIGSDTDDAGALAIAALVVAHLDRDFETASHAIDRALKINPACTTALFFAAHIESFRGEFEPAEEHARKALRLSPFDPWAYEAHVAFAMRPLAAGRFDEAAAHLARAVHANPNFPSPRFLLGLTLGLAGRVEEARREVKIALDMSPATKTRLLREIGLLPSLADKLAEGARAAGMPE
jgi:adenylate cyclase